MHPSKTLFAAAAIALLVAPGRAPVHAESSWDDSDDGYEVEAPYEPEDAPDPEEYREDLGPYGDWTDVPDYGVVWRPTYVAGWQPYVDGYWAWTSYGWTWVSDEPWAWTLHYGRWVVLPAHGWVWVPGTVWGPAWVDWYWGDGFVGWAPLSPFGHVTVINQFVFVHERDFCSHSVRRHFVRHDHLSDRVRREWRERDFRRPPRQDQIQRVAHDPVTRLDGRPRQTLAPHRDRRPDRPDVRPGLTGARRGRGAREEQRDEARRERGDGERRAASRPAGGRDDAGRDRAGRVRERDSRFDGDDGASRRQGGGGWTGRPRVERPDREPRIRGPRFDTGDSQLRPHAWGRGLDHGARFDRGAGRGPDGGAMRMSGSEPRQSGGHRGDGGGRPHGGAHTGFAGGVR